MQGSHGQSDDEQCYIDGLGLLLRLELRGYNIIVEERITKLTDSIRGSVSQGPKLWFTHHCLMPKV
jgi:hypothetical protein